MGQLFAFHTNTKQYHQQKKIELHLGMFNNDFDIRLGSVHFRPNYKSQISIKCLKNKVLSVQGEYWVRMFI